MSKRKLAKDVMEKQENQGKREINPLVYQFLPLKDGEEGDNKLYLGLYDLGASPTLKNLKRSDSWVYCYKVETHYIWDPILKVGGNYICQNPGKNMFVDARSKCQYCETANKYWELRKKYQGDIPYENIKEDAVFKTITNNAKKYSSWGKLPYVVLDIDKVLGKKLLSEADQKDGFGMQCVLMPVNADKEIRKCEGNGYKFWEVVDENGKESDNGNHVFVINITRDNSIGAKNAKYSAQVMKDLVKLPQEWIDCIMDNIPDPLEVLFKHPSEDEWEDMCERLLPTEEEINRCVNLQTSNSVPAPTPAPKPAATATPAATPAPTPAPAATTQEEEPQPAASPRRVRKKLAFED